MTPEEQALLNVLNRLDSQITPPVRREGAESRVRRIRECLAEDGWVLVQEGTVPPWMQSVGYTDHQAKRYRKDPTDTTNVPVYRVATS